MNILLIASCIIISMMLIVRDKQSRFLAFLIGITFLPFGLEVSYKLSAPRILVVAFFISVLFRSNEIKSVKHMPSSFLLLLVFVSHLLTGIFDQRLSLFQGVSKALVMFAETFGSVILGYVSFGTNTKEKKLLKTILVLVFLVTLTLLLLTFGFENTLDFTLLYLLLLFLLFLLFVDLYVELLLWLKLPFDLYDEFDLYDLL